MAIHLLRASTNEHIGIISNLAKAFTTFLQKGATEGWIELGELLAILQNTTILLRKIVLTHKTSSTKASLNHLDSSVQHLSLQGKHRNSIEMLEDI